MGGLDSALGPPVAWVAAAVSLAVLRRIDLSEHPVFIDDGKLITTATIGRGKGNDIRLLRDVHFPHFHGAENGAQK